MRVLRAETVPQLDTFETGFASLRQADFQRRVAAKLAQIVVGPAYRIGADTDCH